MRDCIGFVERVNSSLTGTIPIRPLVRPAVALTELCEESAAGGNGATGDGLSASPQYTPMIVHFVEMVSPH